MPGYWAENRQSEAMPWAGRPQTCHYNSQSTSPSLSIAKADSGRSSQPGRKIDFREKQPAPGPFLAPPLAPAPGSPRLAPLPLLLPPLVASISSLGGICVSGDHKVAAVVRLLHVSGQLAHLQATEIPGPSFAGAPGGGNTQLVQSKSFVWTALWPPTQNSERPTQVGLPGREN